MLLSATKSRKKQQTELVQSVIHAEEEKRRKERKIFHITSVPVLYRAAYEPSLYHGTSDEHEDRKSKKNSTGPSKFIFGIHRQLGLKVTTSRTILC